MYKIKPKTSTSKNVASLTQRVSVGSSGHGPTTPSVNIRPSPRTISGGSIAKRPSYSSALGSGTVCGCTSKSPNVTSTQTPGNRVDQLIEKLKVLENEQKLLSAKIERVTAVLDQLSSSSNSSNECRRCTCPACSAPPAPIHGGRPPPPRSNLQSVPDLDSSESDDCLPVSTVRLAAVPQECFNDVVSDTSVLNISSLNDDLIHDLPACDASSPTKVDDLPVSDVSSPKQGDVSVPNREGGRSHDGATVSRSSLGSGAVGHDKPVKRRRKIAALDPIRRPFIPRRAKSNFRLQNRKQGKTS
ncbi:hypothetical protein M8J75_012549 [Diaphorina citri]|nr:hypothetical protein M8J75_012549 [Diaphorina citri]